METETVCLYNYNNIHNKTEQKYILYAVKLFKYYSH